MEAELCHSKSTSWYSPDLLPCWDLKYCFIFSVLCSIYQDQYEPNSLCGKEMLSLAGRGKTTIQAEQCVKCCKGGSLLYKDHRKRTFDGWLHHLHGERRHKTSTAQLPYLADVFSHGVVIQPSFGLELFFAVLTLQGILQLKELKASHQRGHILPRAAAAAGQ